jgi:3-hydroxybutyryl-CoA dehydrogenase
VIEPIREVRHVGVVGCGLMGSGIAQVCATAGYRTTVIEVAAEVLERGTAGIRKSLDRLRAKNQLPADPAEILARLTPTTDIQSLRDADFVIEAVVENVPVKRELFSRLDGIVRPEAIFASNTSSISITELMTATRRADRFIGLHFFNPVPLMKLVEVVRTVATSDNAYELGAKFASSLGKVVVRTGDRTGFIVNRLLVPYLLDAVRALEEGVASVTDIDQAMKLGCGYPMGPLTLLDFVGIDTTLFIANIMFDEFRETRFAPPPLMKRMVLAGWYGRKSGRGFYDYSNPEQPVAGSFR